MFRERCLCCGADELTEIINLGAHAMADTYIPPDRLSEADCAYPLVCDLCERCLQVQLRTVIAPDERYAKFDYSYTSSNSKTSREHWANYAREVSSHCKTAPGSLVVEVGSNDGFLLAEFQGLGFAAIGIDPSPAMAGFASERGVRTEVDYFSTACAEKLLRNLSGKPPLIVANNVFNHANEPLDFARGVKNLLAPDGTFVFELPSWLCSIEQEKFDQIYHEHVSYFTVSYALNLFASVDMHVVHVEQVDYHGGSIRVFVRHDADGFLDPSVAAFAAREREAGLFSSSTYRGFMTSILKRRHRFLASLYALKASGESVVCIGAAAKGNTFLTFYNLDAFVIDCVTDSSPHKIGKHTPRTRIPIMTDDSLKSYERVHAIILSWNLSTILEAKLRQINPRVQLLNPYEP